MKRYRIARVLKFVLFAAVAVAVLGAAIEGLWNWLMPAIVGARVITFWQALGVLALSRILFGRLGSRGRGMHWRYRIAERWNQMTPEERTKFEQGIRARCGRFESQTTESAR